MPKGSILVDSSWLIALHDKDSDAYEEISEFSKHFHGSLVVPQVVLTEVVYLVKRETGISGTAQFLQQFNDSHPYLQDITVPDLRRVKEIIQQYATARLDFVDCCIMALSERLNITQVGTLDKRDFSIFRPNHVSHLEILP